MTAQIKLRRTTDAARQLITLNNGEPLYTEQKKLYMGDGSTLGGVALGAYLLTRKKGK